ncbi:substrate-binding domain-containing protein [Actinoplanes sp. NPDC048988]|uniref:substrate-binding domain-containing protein n=1 Tax=Actinoplanes sp. NPDC048988 TaxID=3363901 RepID=UPI00371354BA
MTAAPEIAAVVTRAAAAVPHGRAGCDSITVTTEDPAQTLRAARKPDVWIPSSSAWLAMAGDQGGQSSYRSEETLATSPIVIVCPDAEAPKLWAGRPASWAALAGAVAGDRPPALSMPDPTRDSVGLLSILGAQTAMAKSAADAGQAELRLLTLRTKLADANADSTATLAAARKAADATAIGVFPATEQQLWLSRKSGHRIALRGAYPADGPTAADFPVAVRSDLLDEDPRGLLTEKLIAQLHSTTTRELLTASGLRTPQGGVPDGLPEKIPAAAPVPADVAGLRAVAARWSSYKEITSRVLIAVDASGSMNQPVVDGQGRRTTRAEMLRRSALDITRLFGNKTDVGLWFFGSDAVSRSAHTEAVPVGPITGEVGGEQRRKALVGRVRTYQPASGADTPLYRTILDGVSTMKPRGGEGVVTLVVVLTDGRDDTSRYSMAKDVFLSRLISLHDDQRPVPVFSVCYGAGADTSILRSVATLTGGTSVVADKPDDLAAAVAKLFIAARRGAAK